jgi:hypothetical protein
VNTPIDDDTEDLGTVGCVVVGERNTASVPQIPANQVNRDGADNVVDLELVEHRNREHDDHTTDGTDQMAAQRRASAAQR